MRNRFVNRMAILLVVVLCFQPIAPLFAADGLTFRILKPSPDEVITGNIIPIACAFQSTPDAPVVRVEVYLDSQSLISGRMTEPCVAGSFPLDSADYTMLKIHPGQHTLTIKLFTSQGTVTQHEQSIIIRPADSIIPTTTPPKVHIVTPTEGLQLVGHFPVKVEATADAPIAWVEVYLNGKRDYMANEPPYQFTLDPDADHLLPGTYTLTARAVDIFNNETTSSPVKIIIGTPFGWTHYTSDLPQSPDNSPIGLLQISSPLSPSGGSSLERQSYSNLIAPPATWADGGSQLPELNVPGSRVASTADPIMNAFALLPVKSMPAQESLALLPQLQVQGVTQAPSLSALPSQLSPLATASGLTPARGMLFTPMTAPALPAQDKMRKAVQPDAPLLAIPVEFTTSTSKAAPQLGVLLVSPAPNIAPAMPGLAPAVPSSTPAASGLAPGASGLAPAVPSFATTMPSFMPGLVPAAPILMAEAPGVHPYASTPAVKMAPPHQVSETSISKPLGVTTAPLIGAGSTVRTAQATPGMHTPVNWTGLTHPEVLALSLPAADSSSLCNPAGVISVSDPALSPILLAKAIPSANAGSFDNSVVLITPTADSAPSSHAVNAAPAQSQPTIQLHGPYLVKAGDTWIKLARAYSTTPDALARLNPGLSPDRPLVADTRMAVPHPDSHLYLDNHPLTGIPEPYVVRGYSLVPIRKIVEAKHGVVIWIPKTHEVNAWVNQTFMGLTMDSRVAHINGDTYLLPVPATLREKRAMVPLRYVAAALGLQVEYNAETGTYYLISRATP